MPGFHPTPSHKSHPQPHQPHMQSQHATRILSAGGATATTQPQRQKHKLHTHTLTVVSFLLPGAVHVVRKEAVLKHVVKVEVELVSEATASPTLVEERIVVEGRVVLMALGPFGSVHVIRTSLVRIDKDIIS